MHALSLFAEVLNLAQIKHFLDADCGDSKMVGKREAFAINPFGQWALVA